MAKSNNKTHQTNGKYLSYSWLGIGISYAENGGLYLVLNNSLTSSLYDSRIKCHYIDNDVWTKQTDIIGRNVKKGAQPSTNM